MKTRDLFNQREVNQITANTAWHLRSLLQRSSAVKYFRVFPTCGCCVAKEGSIVNERMRFRRLHRHSHWNQHNLSSALVARNLWPQKQRRYFQQEEEYYRELKGRLDTGKSVLEAITELNELILSRKCTLRAGDAYLSSPSVKIALPPAGEALASLSAFPFLATESHSKCRTFENIVIEYVTILNAHIFLDGNGRVARALLAWRLGRLLDSPDHFIPLSEYFWHARGGHDIRLRQAELHAAIEPLARYILRIAKLETALSRALSANRRGCSPRNCRERVAKK
jgi:hypothetical protein